MGGYVPNPVAIVAAKAVGYSVFGWAVRRNASRRGSPVGFGVARLAAGWVVGGALLGLAIWLHPEQRWSDRQVYLAFLVPRFALWAALVHYWFRPRGGVAALVIWSALGVALSTTIDLVVFHFYTTVPWLRIGIC